MKRNKNVVKINESQLQQMISESIKTVLKENYGWKSCVDLADTIMEGIGAEQLCYRLMHRLVGQVGERKMMEILEYIYNTEVSSDMMSNENEF